MVTIKLRTIKKYSLKIKYSSITYKGKLIAFYVGKKVLLIYY